MSEQHPHGSQGTERFERCVRAHHAAVYRAALRVTRSDADAQDVAQQVFLKLLTGALDLAEAEDEERVLRWWAVRLALAHQRGERRLAHREEEYVMEHTADDERVTDTPLEHAEERARLETLVAALPGELRLPLELRFRENLTFAAIGAALELSEPAVHQRVQRALAQLRTRLQRAGLGAFGVQLEIELAREPACPPPPGLATKLLALHAPTAAAGFLGAPLLALAVAVVLALGGAAWFVARDGARGAETQRALAAHTPPPATPLATDAGDAHAPEREAAAPSAPRSEVSNAQAPTPPLASGTRAGRATLSGRVADESGLGVGDVTVWAGEPAKGFPHFSASSHGLTRPDGSFRFEIELARDAVLVEVRADHADYAPLARTELVANRGADVRVPELVVRPVRDDRPGEFTFALTLVDTSGQACAGVPVRLFRRGKTFAGLAGDEWESGGQSDAFGRVELTGEHLGRKLLVVAGRALGWREVRTRFELEGAGRRAETIVLERGAVLAGRVLTLAGEPIADASVYVSAGSGADRAAEQVRTDARGAFRVSGLDAGVRDVRVDAGPYSAACLTADAGREDLEIRLKLADDPRDVGAHCAELHGSLRDARTGAPFPLALDGVEVVAVKSTTRAEFLAGEYLAHLSPIPRQVLRSGDEREPAPSAEFHRTGLAEGRCVVVARAPGRAVSFAGPFELGPQTLVADIALALEPAARLTVRVRAPDGAPVARAWLWCVARDTDTAQLAELDRELVRTAGEPREWWSARRTDARGELVLANLSAGAVLRVFALHASYAPVASDALTLAESGELELLLGSAR